MKKDPVCGMNVDEKKAIKINYNGKTFYFCNTVCKWAFTKNPNQFLK